MAQLRLRLSPPRLVLLITLLFAVIFAGGCGTDQATSSSGAEATIAALATTNAQLSTRVAELSVSSQAAPQATPNAAPAATPEPPPAAQATTTGISPAGAEDSPLPNLLISLVLAAEGETLFDMRLDRASNHIFVTDSSDQLHVVDATTNMPLQVLPYGGVLELDASRNRLYVYKPYVNEGEESLIHILDTQTLAEVGTLTGRALAIDSARNRLFVGEPYGISTPEDAPGVRIVDGATLQETGSFTQTGAPRYNPLRDELLIAAYTVYSADPTTQLVTADLFPELTDLGENGFLWCNGCTWVDDVAFYPQEQLVAVSINAHCAGKGCGTVASPHFFDANTMQPLDPAAAPKVQADCGSQSELLGPVAGRRYMNAIYDRYVVFTNFLVTDAQGALIALRDGLRVDYVNGHTGQGYLYDGTVIDLATLTPMGRWPAACLFTAEPDTGLLFGRRGNSLYVIAARGAAPGAPEPALPEVLPQEWPIRQIVPSPNFAADNTLLAVTGRGIYRSTDGGERWMRLQGDLPQNQGSNWTVAFSPAYAADQTIFAGGDRGEYWGEGVWRSQDGGTTWQAQWADLQHRRITNFYFSPDFATNGAMVAQAKFFDVASGLNGDSYQQSLDGGVSWTLVVTGNVATAAGQTPLPPVSELLPSFTPAPDLPVRSTAGGNGTVLFSLLPAPDYPASPTVYAFGNNGIWRSDDDGLTWSSWDDTRLEGLDYTNNMSTAAMSPLLSNGTYRLFVGTANGEVWALDPAAMTWRPAAGMAQPPSPLAVATTVPAPAAEDSSATTAIAPTTATTATTATAVTTATATAPLTTTATAEPLAGEPPAGLFRPAGTTGLFWQNNVRAQQDLGWARQANPAATGGAYQQFDHGTMVWRQDTSQIYVFFADGTWRAYPDTFAEGDPESDPTLSPPAGRLQPIRGFGKVWRDHSDVREKLGWATAKETAQNAEIHTFERGAMLRYGPLLFITVGVDTDRGTWY